MLGEAGVYKESERRSFYKARQKTFREVRTALNNDDPPLSCLAPIWHHINYYVAYSSWLVFCGIVGGRLFDIMYSLNFDYMD